MRVLMVLLASGLGLASLSAAQSHKMRFAGGGTSSDPNEPMVEVEAWDISPDQIPPAAQWLGASMSITSLLTDEYDLAPRRDGLRPPMNPVEPSDRFSTFYSARRYFPNDVVNNTPLSLSSEIIAAGDARIELSWSATQPEDGVGPTFVMFRLAVSRPLGSLGLTLTPIGAAAVDISGESTFGDGDGARAVVPFNFKLYQLPEPASALLLLAGAVRIRPRSWRRSQNRMRGRF